MSEAKLKRIAALKAERARSDDPAWWPPHVRAVFAALGEASKGQQLRPEMISLVPRDLLPRHVVKLIHRSGKKLGRRKGMYELKIEGPVFEGLWGFTPGKLDRLSKAATR